MSSTRRQRSGLRGVNRLRRTLRRINDTADDGVGAAIRTWSHKIAEDAKANAPELTGETKESIEAIVSRDGLTSTIGPGARALRSTRRQGFSVFATRALNLNLSKRNTRLLRAFYKAYWYEFGTKGNPAKNIPPQPAQPFMGPAYDANAEAMKADIRRAIRTTLERASRGARSGNV